MFTLIVLFLLIGYTLFHMLSEKNDIFYRDVRFWLVVASLCVLIWLTVHSYSN